VDGEDFGLPDARQITLFEVADVAIWQNKVLLIKSSQKILLFK